MEEVRLGTIGSGVIVHSVLDGVRKAEGIQLEAVYSRTREKAEELAREYGANKTYTDLDAFLADPEVNCVYIATPNLLHYEQTKRALEAGKHVICEKPFCTRADQAEELFALAGEKGLFLTEAAPTTFLPNYDLLQRELPKVGRVRLVMGNYSQYSSRYDKLLAGELPNIFNPQYAGGCLMDINFYNVYLTLALFGAPNSSVYSPNLFQTSSGPIDTSGVVTLGYDGFTASLAGAKDTWGENYYLIEGEQGYIYVKGGSNSLSQIRVVTRTSDEVVGQLLDPEARWDIEMQVLPGMLLREDHAAFDARRTITIDTVRTIESLRRQAGIRFPQD